MCQFSTGLDPVFSAPVLHRAATVGIRIGAARRSFAEAALLVDEAAEAAISAAARAAWRREAHAFHRSARRLLFDVAH
ncbi:hypothetical protein HLH26_08270 [Gluconacetobacter sp. 1b LMG 1731]|uniref:Uncharacterized protein n=1 Tax=Gluconacetobacter dulcium TaxID=2729096 RepID=A0A7W4IKE9_9PROT|nr:hypothetical protein [Gluconacetobacter dulcium]MBB2164536.1 hypothetical protein [Gluconacetobacter dulcium]MBB2193697.1 hypothetical protein [Gluconacetobacter dulcium]